MKNDICGFEHLHRHSDFSVQDGFATVAEYAEYQHKINQKFLCITDHGVMGAVPSQISEAEKHNLFPIFGVELYLNALQPKVEHRYESAEFRKSLTDPLLQKKFDKSRHLLAIAYSNVGYENLVQLTSWAWIHGYYRKPRINHEILQKHREGIIFTSTCANSEIAGAFFEGGDDQGFDMVRKYLDLFGENFYLELMMLDFKDQRPYNQFLIRAHDKFNIPMILTQDCHYCKKEHSYNQRIMLMQQNKRTLEEINILIESGAGEELFELQDPNLYLKSEEELNRMWNEKFQDIDYEIFKQAKANTVAIAEKAKGVEIDRALKLPCFENDDVKLMNEVNMGFKIRNLPENQLYLDRIQEEYKLITEKGFSSYFLIKKEIIDQARKIGPQILGFGDGSEVVGPGRGCLHPEVPVLFKDGDAGFIKDIQVGNEVCTIDGSFRKVTKVMKYPLVNEKLLRIKVRYGDYCGVALTFDHEIYASKDGSSLEWMRADKLKVGDFCYIPVPKVDVQSDFHFDLSSLNGGIWKLNEHLALILGAFVGGNSSVHDGVVEFNFIRKDIDFDTFRCLFNNECSINKSDCFSASESKLTYQSASLGYLLNSLCYLPQSNDKNIPECILHAPLEMVGKFIEGLYLNSEKTDVGVDFHAPSLRVAHQLRFLLLRLGVPSSIKEKGTFVVTCPLDVRLGLPACNADFADWKKVEDGILVKITSISEEDGPDYVHDIEVENNHNYLTSSFLVHNSVCGSLIAYCLRIHDVNPIEHDLSFARFLSPSRGGKQMKIRHSINPVKRG